MHARTHHVLRDEDGASRLTVEHRLDPAALACVFGEWTRPQIARRAAVNLASHPDMSWARNARRATTLDDLGFVRRCVQAAMDWDPDGAVTAWADPLDDAFLPPTGPHQAKWSHNPNAVADLCHAWGLWRVDLKGRRAGDVLVYPVSLHDPCCAILVDRGATPADRDRIAYITPAHGPEIRRPESFGPLPVAAFTWPEKQP